MTRPVYFNGRILSRPMGGVRRYAEQVMDRWPELRVLRPGAAGGPIAGRVWEQTTLGRQSADGVLLSPANAGPLRHANHVVVMHDAFAVTQPDQVHPAFRGLNRFQLPRLAERADRVVTVSRESARAIASVTGRPIHEIDVIAPGTDHLAPLMPPSRDVACQLLHIDPSRPIVAAVVDPTPRKRPAELVQVLNTLGAEGHQVIAVGRLTAAAFAGGQTRRQVRNGRDLGPADDVRLAALLTAADVFVSMSSGEGFGLPVAEAMRAGCAVVTTPVPVATEHGDEACLIVDTPADVVDAARALLADAHDRARLATNAIDAMNSLTSDRTTRELRSVVASLDSRQPRLNDQLPA